MALRRSHSGDENIDPFNAPDPVMPSEEPEREDPDPDDGIARIKRRDERRRGNMSGAASNSYQPPTYNHDDASSAHGSSWQGASTGTNAGAESASSHHHNRSKRAPRAPRTHHSEQNTSSRTASCAIYLIIFILLSGAIASGAGMLLSSCSAAVGDVFEGLFEDDGPRYEDIEPSAPREVEDAVVSAVQTETKLQLDALIAGESDGVSRFEQGATDIFQSYCGATPEELGLSAHEIAIWQLSHASYDLSSAHAYLSQIGEGYKGTANVYFDFTAPDITALAFELSAHLPNGYLEPGEADALTPEDLQKIRAAYDAYTAGEPEYEERFSVMNFEAATDLEGGNCAIALDTEAWNTELDWLAM